MGAQFRDPETGTVVDHTHRTDFDRSWRDLWPRQQGWKRDLLLRGAMHYSYTDFQVILPQIAGPLGLPDQLVHAVVGTIDPGRSVAAQRAYPLAFFDRHLRHRPGHLLDRPSPRHPDIQFVW